MCTPESRKKEYLKPEYEVFTFPKRQHLLLELSADGIVSDYEGDELEDF